MTHQLGNIPLILTPNKLFKEINSDSGIQKRRKLSMSSESSDSGSSYEKNLLDEQFQNLNIENMSNAPKSEGDGIKLEDIPTRPHVISIPKPIKHLQPTQNQDGNQFQVQQNGEFFKNLWDMSQNDIPGIQKYLSLDNSELFPDISNLLNTPKSTEEPTPKLNTASMMTSFAKNPFLTPFLNPELFEAINQTRTHKYSGKVLGNHSAPEFQTQNFGLGTSSSFEYGRKLTKQERKEKVDKYLEKKYNRKWKHIRYGVRKDLADKRERVQGRFVKTNKGLSRSEVIQKIVENGSTEMKPRKGNNLNENTSSISLGKRTDKTELVDDPTIPKNYTSVYLDDEEYNRVSSQNNQH